MRDEIDITPEREEPPRLTEFVSRVMDVMILTYLRLIEGAGSDLKLVLTYAARMQRHVRRMTRMNYKFRLYERREALKHNPDLRKQVRYDLGGKAAMVLWERRRRGAMIVRANRNRPDPHPDIPMPDFAKPAKRYPRKTPCKWQPKTDRSGHYRLAAIKTGPMENPPKRKAKAPTNSNEPKITRRYEMRFLPLEVTPDELRPTYVFSSGYSPPLNESALSNGHSPPIDRPPI